MEKYHKIQSVFKRDPENKFKTFLMGEWSEPEFGYLAENEWIFSEKVDGTNIRVGFEGGEVLFGGRTDNAQIPAFLVNVLREMFTPEAMGEVFDQDGATLYGEGYGAKIQKGGGNYRDGQSFVLFDVRVGDCWLKREDVEDIAVKLRIECVPIIGTGTINDAIALCKEGFLSRWGNFRAEGIVLRPAVELKTRMGHRVITKVKCKDFPS